MNKENCALKLVDEIILIPRHGSVPGHHRYASAGTDGKWRYIYSYIQRIDSLIVSLQNSEYQTFMKILQSLKKTLRQYLYVVAFKEVPGIRWYDLQKLLHERTFPKTVKEIPNDIFYYLRDTVRKKHSEKRRNQHLVSPSRQCSNTPVRICQRFLRKEQCDSTSASPIFP